MQQASANGWIGASLLRKEDARHLYGHGMFIADVNVPGVQDVAFVRSQMAHAQVGNVIKPPQAVGRVFTLPDIGPLNILEAGPELSAHCHSPYPPLADGRVRYVGQTIAACVMPTRAQAEDLADGVRVELEELPAIVDVVAAMRTDSPRVFDEWPSNAYISISVIEGNPETLAAAPICLAVGCASIGRPPFRWKAEACSPTGIIGSMSSWSTFRRKAARSSGWRCRGCLASRNTRCA